MPELSHLCIHQITLNQCDFRQSIECFSRHNVPATVLWREKLEAFGIHQAAHLLQDHAIAVTALAPCGLLSARDAGVFAQSLDDNRRWIDHCTQLGIASMVMLSGGLAPGETDLRGARERALEGLATLIPYARTAGVVLALEPLHPMVCGLRSVISTLREANDWLDQLAADDVMRIAFDTYALWWEPNLAQEIRRAGARIGAYHVSDWLADTQDVRLDRGMPGDGQIDLPALRAQVEAVGYEGDCEIEIFSTRNWWRREPDEVIQVIKQRFARAV